MSKDRGRMTGRKGQKAQLWTLQVFPERRSERDYTAAEWLGVTFPNRSDWARAVAKLLPGTVWMSARPWWLDLK